MTLLHSVQADGFQYTSVLIHPQKPLGFAGTSEGMVEVWRLDTMEKRAELHYLVIDRYGNQLPVVDPVVNLASPLDFNFVYAFMGNYAYCIDVEMLTIVEKVPISEQVVSGNIAAYSGEIGVITNTGYLSRWAAQFVVRIGHLLLPYRVQTGYLLHDIREERIIFVQNDGRLMVASMEKDPYTVELHYPPASQLLDGIWYDRNHNHQIFHEESVLHVADANYSHPKLVRHILAKGKTAAEDQIRIFVEQADTGEAQRNYIKDFRLERESRDRYVAEVDRLHNSDKQVQTSIREDSKTVHFAMNELENSTLESKTTAYSVIEKMSDRYDVSSRYLFFAHRIGVKSTELVEKGRYFEFEAHRRSRRILRVMLLTLLMAILTLVATDTYVSSNGSLPRIYLFPLVITFVLLIYWRSLASLRLPGVPSYTSFQVLAILVCLASIVYDLVYSLPGVGIPV